MKINKLEFVSGNSGSDEPLIIEPKRITIFVGPNNSGKSQALTEINTWLCGGNPSKIVLSKIGLNLPSYEEIVEWLVGLEVSKQNDEKYIHLFRPSILEEKPEILRLKLTSGVRGKLEAWENSQDEAAYAAIRANTLRWGTIRIEGRNIFLLASGKDLGDLQAPPTSNLVKLFKDAPKREEWREMCGRSFPKMYVAIDHTSSRQLNIRMADRPPRQEEETGLDDPAIEFYRRAIPIQSTGDGVHAFTGLSSVLVGIDWRFLLIDDPEVYLHLPVARKLGADISTIAEKNNAQVFVSTHSSYFLQGCLDVCDEVTLVRLTFNSTTKDSTAYCLPSDKVRNLASHPLLKSTRVFDALFHEAVIVTEGDTDRIFYEEMNRMLLEHQKGHHECLFICPHSRDVVGEIVSPLTSLGIPTAVIVDLDFLWDGGKKWNELLIAMGITDECKQTINELSCSIKQDLQKASVTRRDFKENGIWALEKDLQNRLQSLFDLLNEKGVFCVPNGELESWFTELDITGSTKTKKIMDCLDKVQDKNPIEYSTQDNTPTAWDFIDSVTHWLKTGETRQERSRNEFHLPIFDLSLFLSSFYKSMNHENGGSIYIGLQDSGIVRGLNPSLQILNFTTNDEFLLHIRNLIMSMYGDQVLQFVYMGLKSAGEKTICEVTVMYVPEKYQFL